MKKSEFCIEEFIADAIMECPERCIVELKEKDKLVLSVPVDKLTEFLTKKFREYLAEFLEKDTIKEILQKKYIIGYEGEKQALDLDGIVISFTKEKFD